MKTFRSLLELSLALVATALMMAPLHAANVEVYLDQSNVNLGFPDGTNYLKVSISEGAGGNIDFKVDTLSSLRDQANSNYGIQTFSLNFGGSGASAANLLLSNGWSVKGGRNEKSSPNHSIFGKFDAQLKGTGRNRKDPLEFSIVGIAGDTPADYITKLSSGNVLFAGHVAGFNSAYDNLSLTNKNISSGQFGGGSSSVVPLPASVWLMLSALTILGWCGRKSAAKKLSREMPDAAIAA